MSRWPLFFALSIVLGFFCYTVFSTLPYLQHEIIDHAAYWTDPNVSFLETLFDGYKMDGGPGRFRYMGYIAEAIYWKLMFLGFLPHDLYDYFNILSVFLVAFLLYKIAKEKNLSPLETLLSVSFFILSANAFIVTVFNYRKGKVVVLLLFALIFWVSEWKKNNRSSFALLATCGFLGFFTDPFFNLSVPILFLCRDYSKKDFRRSKAILTGMFFAFLALIVLNGFIGPNFNPNTQLMFYGYTAQHNSELLSFKNALAFPRVLSDLLVPGFITEPSWTSVREVEHPGIFTETSWVGWLLIFLITALLVIQRKWKFPDWGLTLGFLILLPACSFLILPVSIRASYSGYYGYPFIMVFSVLIMNLFVFLRTFKNSKYYSLGVTFAVLFISLHQQGKNNAFKLWVEHSLFPISRELYEADYKKIKEVDRFLKQHPSEEYLYEIELRDGPRFGHYAQPGNNVSDLVFFAARIFFNKAQEEKRLLFKNVIAKVPPPEIFLWSDALRFPYYSEPVPFGTAIDVRWETHDADSCRIEPHYRQNRDPLSQYDLNGHITLTVEKMEQILIRCEGPGGYVYRGIEIKPQG